MAQTQNPILMEMRPFLRPKGCDELWDLLLKLKGLDEMHSLKDKHLYQTNHRDKRSAAAAMTSAYNGMADGILLSSHDSNTIDNPVGAGSGSSIDGCMEMSLFSTLADSFSDIGASRINLQHTISSISPTTSASSSSSSSSSNINVHAINVTTSGASLSDSIAPYRFTRDECELFNDKLNRCRKQTSHANHIQWHTLEYIFEEAANQPLQSVTRTIWPRTEARLQNWYDNNVRPAQKKQRLEDDQDPIPNSQPQLIINSSSSGSSAGVDGSVNSGASAVERHYRSDALTPEEERIIIDTGKAMKMSGDVVNGAVLSTAYCRHFLSSKRDPKVLAEKWQKWFRNQRKSPGTAWYKDYKNKYPTAAAED